MFFDQVSPQNTGDIWYSNPRLGAALCRARSGPGAAALNRVNEQHAYSTPYDGKSDPLLQIGKVPAGVYVGFEDLSIL